MRCLARLTTRLTASTAVALREVPAQSVRGLYFFVAPDFFVFFWVPDVLVFFAGFLVFFAVFGVSALFAGAGAEGA